MSFVAEFGLGLWLLVKGVSDAIASAPFVEHGCVAYFTLQTSPRPEYLNLAREGITFRRRTKHDAQPAGRIKRRVRVSVYDQIFLRPRCSANRSAIHPAGSRILLSEAMSKK